MWHCKISPESVDSNEAQQPTGGGSESVEPCQESRTTSGTSAGRCAQREGETTNISLILQRKRKKRSQVRKFRRKRQVQNSNEDSDSDKPTQNQESDDPPHSQSDSSDILPRDHRRRRRRQYRPKNRSTGRHRGDDDSDDSREGTGASIPTISSSWELQTLDHSRCRCGRTPLPPIGSALRLPPYMAPDGADVEGASPDPFMRSTATRVPVPEAPPPSYQEAMEQGYVNKGFFI